MNCAQVKTFSEPSVTRGGRVRVPILGCDVDSVDQRRAMEIMAGFLMESKAHQVVTADSSMVVNAQSDAELRWILETADLIVPDSIGVVWASRILGTPLKERVTGVDLVASLCEHAAAHQQSIFLLGAAPGVAERAGRNLCARYPGLVVAGSQHGFFSAEEEADVVAAVRDARPDILFVAMGIPRQEKWLSRHLPTIGARVGMGVGGSLDVFAGEVKRAPNIFRRTNLEWLYRISSNPRRHRKARTLPIFAWLTLGEWLRRRGGSKRGCND